MKLGTPEQEQARADIMSDAELVFDDSDVLDDDTEDIDYDNACAE